MHFIFKLVEKNAICLQSLEIFANKKTHLSRRNFIFFGINRTLFTNSGQKITLGDKIQLNLCRTLGWATRLYDQYICIPFVSVSVRKSFPSYSPDRSMHSARSKARLTRLFTHLRFGRLNIVHTKNRGSKGFRTASVYRA